MAVAAPIRFGATTEGLPLQLSQPMHGLLAIAEGHKHCAPAQVTLLAGCPDTQVKKPAILE
jgi:hypothetical protein